MDYLILSLTLTVTCPKTEIVNHTKVWTSYDQEILEHSKVRCSQIYKESPCVKRFIKKEEQLYNVICSGGSK